MAKRKNNNSWFPLVWLLLVVCGFVYGLNNGASFGHALVIGLEWFGIVFVGSLFGMYFYQALFTKAGWKQINEDLERRERRKEDKRARRRAKYGPMMRQASKGFLFGVGFGAADGLTNHNDGEADTDV